MVIGVRFKPGTRPLSSFGRFEKLDLIAEARKAGNAKNRLQGLFFMRSRGSAFPCFRDRKSAASGFFKVPQRESGKKNGAVRMASL
jgi:hypothetical protein